MLSLPCFLLSAHLIDSIKAIQYFRLIDFLLLFLCKINVKVLLKGHSKANQSIVCILLFQNSLHLHHLQSLQLPENVSSWVSLYHSTSDKKHTVSYFSCWVRWNIPKCGYCIKFLKSWIAVLNIPSFCGDLTRLFSVIMFAFC